MDSDSGELAVVVVAAIRLSLAGVFAFSSVMKFKSMSSFAQTVSRFDVLPRFVVRPTAYAVVAGELATSIALIVPGDAFAAGMSGLLLTTAFFIAVMVNLVRRRAIPCGCFGDDPRPISAMTLLRLGLIWIALASLVLLFRAVDGFPAASMDVLATILCAIAFTLGGSWLLRVPSITVVIIRGISRVAEGGHG